MTCREEAHPLACVDAFVLSLIGLELACVVQVGRGVNACPLLQDEEARNVQQDVEHEASEDELRMIGLEPQDSFEAYKGKGCLACRNTGFKGRIGIYELLLVDAEISELVLEQAPGYKIREQARKNGMRTLLEDGIIKVNRGDTTISEVYETLGTTKIII